MVFVIVVIGILVAIAIPRFAVTRDDAQIAKARATVAALRTAVAVERQKRILKGDFSDITDTEARALLDSGLDHHWSSTGFTHTAPDNTTCTFSVTNNKLVKGACNVAGMSDL